jgi:hypothetical protein
MKEPSTEYVLLPRSTMAFVDAGRNWAEAKSVALTSVAGHSVTSGTRKTPAARITLESDWDV